MAVDFRRACDFMRSGGADHSGLVQGWGALRVFDPAVFACGQWRNWGGGAGEGTLVKVLH